MEIIVASYNGYKIRETKQILKQFPCFDIFSLLDFPNYKSLKNSGLSIEDIASNKALHAAQILNRPSIADTSFLVVPSLNGEPGLDSENYAGNGASEKDNRKKLLDAMRHLEGPLNRACYFECCFALAFPDGTYKVTKGICEGSIAVSEKGGGGFGYDPLFLKHDYKLTFAELPEEIKNKISHRCKAIKKLLPDLESLASAHKI